MKSKLENPGGMLLLQVVCTIWGDKYNSSHIEKLYNSVRKYYHGDLLFICVSDNVGIKLNENITVKPFPDIGVDFRSFRGRCQAKLSIFIEGVLDAPDARTIYIDLDTMVFGDIGKIACLLGDKNDLFLLEILPGWLSRVYRALRYVLPQMDKTYWANSSVILFYPKSFYWLGELYKGLSFVMATDEGHPSREAFPGSGWVLKSDQRFISFFARRHVKIIPSALVAKFRDEWSSYLTPWIAWAYGLVPFVKRRRETFLLITFNNPALRADFINSYEEGSVVKLTVPFRYWGNRYDASLTKYLFWNRSRFSDYWDE